MAKQHITPQVEAWVLDYGWAKRGGLWTVSSDVLLEAKIRVLSQDKEKFQAAIDKWLEECVTTTAFLDNRMIRIWCHGGVWSYGEWEEAPNAASESQASTVGYSRFFHAKGEDAFDSLCHSSEDLVRVLKYNGLSPELIWFEHSHQRMTQHLSFEPGI